MHTIHWENIVPVDSSVLLAFGIKSMILCAAAGLAHYLLRKRSATLCHFVWAVCMASLLALPIVTQLVPHWALSGPKAMQPAFVEPVSSPGIAASQAATDATAKGMELLPGRRALLIDSDTRADRQLGWLMRNFLPALWAVGCALLVGHIVLGYGIACLIARFGTQVDGRVAAVAPNQQQTAVQFIQTRHVRVPMLFGILKPVVLLPDGFEDWPEDRRRTACQHELAHHQRRDCLTYLMARLGCAVFWPNPLVWIGARLMAALRERACDELVVKTGVKRSEYADQLLEIARRFKPVSALGLGVVSSNRVSSLEKRIWHILRECPTADAGRVSKSIGLSVAFGLLIGIAGYQAHGKPGSSSSPLPTSAPAELVMIKGKWANALECALWTVANVGKTNQVAAKLMPEAEIRGEGAPTFSPDRAQMAFAVWTDGHSILEVRELKSGVERRLNTGIDDCDSPSWSPDGKRIAFVGWANQRTSCHIFTINLDGTERRQLTEGDAQFNWGPAYSPDGKKILWEHEEGESNDQREIYVMNLDGSDQVNLTHRFGVDHHPAWSPDGSKIAFMSRRETGNAEIYVMNADGSNPVNLTKYPARDSEPAWSPDGQWIAFTRSENSASTDFSSMDVYVMRADGTEQTNITKNERGISCWNPVWNSARQTANSR